MMLGLLGASTSSERVSAVTRATVTFRVDVKQTMTRSTTTRIVCARKIDQRSPCAQVGAR
jgi:hypothetical protein